MLSDIIVFNRVGVNMNILEIINRKKNGLSLSYDELEYGKFYIKETKSFNHSEISGFQIIGFLGENRLNVEFGYRLDNKETRKLIDIWEEKSIEE